jgi:putative endonuclease
MIIYKITSLIDNKIYVGQSCVSLNKRIQFYKADVSSYKKGKYKARSRIIRALAKYGFENFTFIIIDNASSKEELDLKEKDWIRKLNSCDKKIGFNIQLGGFGVGKHSDETKKIMSEKAKGRIPYNKGKTGVLSGENVGNASLTQKQADQIRQEYKEIRSSIKLAKKYNVSKPTILSIINNETYKTSSGPIKLDPRSWFVYLIQSLKDMTIYTGITIDVNARLKTHNEGRGARYTRGRTPFVIIKTFEVSNKSEALKLEFKIKKMSREEKL